MVIISVFQTDDGGSIPPTRSINKTTVRWSYLWNGDRGIERVKHKKTPAVPEF